MIELLSDQIIATFRVLLSLQGITGLPPEAQAEVDQAIGRLEGAVRDIAQAIKET